MKNYLRNFSELFNVNEMASTLGKLGVPSKLVKVIHNLPDEIETMRPFTYNKGHERTAELPPIGQNRPGHDVQVLDEFQMKKTKLLGDKYRPSTKDRKIAKEKYDQEVESEGEENVEMPLILKGDFHAGGAVQGYLADMNKFPIGKDMRVLLAVPEPGGKYAGQAPRFDYIYHKGSAWGKKYQGGGKKYRILTMDGDGRILRDWQAYQGDLTYPRNPNDPEDAPRRRRNDFKDFPTDANGMIKVYILDPETVDHEVAYQDMGGYQDKVPHDVPIGKARKLGRKRKHEKFEKADSFIEDFAKKFDKIITSIFGKRKEKAREKYVERIAAREDVSTDEMRNLFSVIKNKEKVKDNLTKYYRQFLKYLYSHGKYDVSNIVEILDVDGNDIPGLSPIELKGYASITDVVNKHNKMSTLRKLAEFILTGEVDDIHKEMELEVDELEDEEKAGDFESMLDYEGIDLEDPFGEEEK